MGAHGPDGDGDIFNHVDWTRAVSAPPLDSEPETYAMLLAGLGLLGFMVRRRRTSLNAAFPQAPPAVRVLAATRSASRADPRG